MHVITARVGPSVPRQERPARDGARVASIETGLAAAAAKLSHQVCQWTVSLQNGPVSTSQSKKKYIYISIGGAAENQEEEKKHQKEGTHS